MPRKSTIQKASFVLPKRKTFKVWLGFYGGHFDIAVLFSRKPRFKEEHHAGKAVDCYRERQAGNILATMALGDFLAFFPTLKLEAQLPKGRPCATEILYKDLIQVELELPVMEDGELFPVQRRLT